MPRLTRIAVPSDETEGLVAELRNLPGLVSLELYRGASLAPAGDVIVLDSTDQGLLTLFRIMDGRLRARPDIVMTTVEPAAMVSLPKAKQLRSDSSELPWEELDLLMQQEGGMTANALIVMFVSGFLACLGLAAGALHLVLAGMLIAPAFEPISRIPLGVLSRGRIWRRAVRDTVSGYITMAAGSALAVGCMLAFGMPLMHGKAWYDPTAALVGYWTSFDGAILLSISAAGIGAAVLVATRRAILTGGAVIALGLVPSVSTIPLALAAGELGVAGRAAGRWATEAGLVVVTSAIVFAWKRRRVHRRNIIG